MIMFFVGIQEKPPLLQTYILPSGPSAAPFGPPGICATTSLRPSGWTRVSLCPRISTSITEPPGITPGPWGNSRPVATTRTLVMKILPLLLWLQADSQDSPAHATFRCLPLWQSGGSLPSNHARPQGCIAVPLVLGFYA